MSVSGDVNELNQLDNEIKRVQSHLKELRIRKQTVESRIIDYLQQKNQPGVKYKGKALVLENKTKRINKSKVNKETDAISILSQYDIPEPEKVLEKILESRRGQAQEVTAIKIKTIKNNDIDF